MRTILTAAQYLHINTEQPAYIQPIAEMLKCIFLVYFQLFHSLFNWCWISNSIMNK